MNRHNGALEDLEEIENIDVVVDDQEDTEALDKLDILRMRLDKIEAFLVDFGWP